MYLVNSRFTPLRSFTASRSASLYIIHQRSTFNILRPASEPSPLGRPSGSEKGKTMYLARACHIRGGVPGVSLRLSLPPCVSQQRARRSPNEPLHIIKPLNFVCIHLCTALSLYPCTVECSSTTATGGKRPPSTMLRALKTLTPTLENPLIQ